MDNPAESLLQLIKSVSNSCENRDVGKSSSGLQCLEQRLIIAQGQKTTLAVAAGAAATLASTVPGPSFYNPSP